MISTHIKSMNFNNLASTIVENINSPSIPAKMNEGKRGRQGNAEIAALVAQGIPYWKARSMVKAGSAKSVDAPVAAAPAVSVATSKGDAKTQAAVDDFISGNPEASVEDVVNHLKNLNDSPVGIKVNYNTNPTEVERMVSVAKGEGSSEEMPEPTVVDISSELSKDPEIERLTGLFMKLYKMPKDQRAAYMRKLKAAEAEKAVEKDVDTDEDDDEDTDPYVADYVKSMKPSEEDEVEFDEPKD